MRDSTRHLWRTSPPGWVENLKSRAEKRAWLVSYTSRPAIGYLLPAGRPFVSEGQLAQVVILLRSLPPRQDRPQNDVLWKIVIPVFSAYIFTEPDGFAGMQ